MDLVEHIVSDPHASKYVLNGFQRLAGDRRGFVVVQALVSRISESLLVELMEDARIMKRAEELHSLVLDELKWVSELPIEVYRFLGGIAGMSGSALRDRCIRVGHVTFAFLQFRIFDMSKSYPFCLAAGAQPEWVQALLRLRDGPEPDEQMTWQLWTLLRGGYPMHRLLKVLQGLQHLEWSTLTSEQLHSG